MTLHYQLKNAETTKTRLNSLDHLQGGQRNDINSTISKNVKLGEQLSQQQSEIAKTTALKKSLHNLSGRATTLTKKVDGLVTDMARDVGRGLQQLKEDTRANKLDTKKELSHLTSVVSTIDRNLRAADSSDSRIRSELRGLYAAIAGNVVISGDDDAGQSAATLTAAGAGSVEVLLTFRLQMQYGADFLDHLGWPSFIHPLITMSENVLDGTVGKPSYYYLSAPKAAAGTVTWPGGSGATAVVTMDDTTGLDVGAALRPDSDGHWFEVISMITDTSATVANPHGLTLPTGAEASSIGNLPRFDVNGRMTLHVLPDVGGKTYLDGEDLGATADISALVKPFDLSAVASKALSIPIIA
jgi:hypothetical protein